MAHNISPYSIAYSLRGEHEIPGPAANPLILWMLGLDGHDWAVAGGDETAWCAAFLKAVAHLSNITDRPHTLMARHWLRHGTPIDLADAEWGWDVVILSRGSGEQPGPEVLDAPGHVGLFDARFGPSAVVLLGGNQGNAVTTARYPVERVLGVRRLG